MMQGYQLLDTRPRKRSGLTRAQLAKRMKTTQSAIARLESGRGRPSTTTLSRFAKATGHKLKISFEPVKKDRRRVRRSRNPPSCVGLAADYVRSSALRPLVKIVARMKRSGMRGYPTEQSVPDCAALHPGYAASYPRLAKIRSPMDFETEISRLRNKIQPLERFVHLFGISLDAPRFHGHGDGFRFENPNLAHFCLLRSARIVSALNASVELARSGFSQEIGVLLRTMIEYSTQLDFVRASLDSEGGLSNEASEFIRAYFEDSTRPVPKDKTNRSKLVQKRVHDIIGKRLDDSFPHARERSASQMLSNIYLIFSNYVHGRYPETMDLYGGRPAHFHLNGMSRTPKDRENLETIDTLIGTASLSLLGIVQALKLFAMVNSDPMLSLWYGQLVKDDE